MLAEAAAVIGDPQVRNYGTIGGSVAHADPAADWPAILLALLAEVRAVGPKGARTIKVDDFFKDLFTTALGPDEVLTEIRIPIGGHGGAAYEKHRHPASRFAVVGSPPRSPSTGRASARRRTSGSPASARRPCAPRASRRPSPARRSTRPRSPRPPRRPPTASTINADLQGSVEYKAHLTRVYTRRALERAVERAKGAK